MTSFESVQKLDLQQILFLKNRFLSRHFMLNIENEFDNFLKYKNAIRNFLNCRKTKILIITKQLNYQLTFRLGLYS